MTSTLKVAATLERLAAGDLRLLARAISVVEDGADGAAQMLEACRTLGRRARRIGVTGAPGAGKSTLVDQMVRQLRLAGETVGVIAFDPSSPYTGGALLGDRIRLQGFSGDDGVYIRSMASRGALGGLSRTAEGVCAVMEAAGRSTVILETVGVGQDEVEIARLADVTLLVLVPGMGDDVQTLKAGVMEIADIYVVNKSDLPGAERVEAEIVAMQHLGATGTAWVAPVVHTVASTGAGIQDLLDAVTRCLRKRKPRPLGPGNSGAIKLDQIGIAVSSIAAAQAFYTLLGLTPESGNDRTPEDGRTAALTVGESRIVLRQAGDDDATIARFLQEHGEGVHHVALRVDRLDERYAELRAAGVRMASDQVRTGPGGRRSFFVHPSRTGGVLLELVGL